MVIVYTTRILEPNTSVRTMTKLLAGRPRKVTISYGRTEFSFLQSVQTDPGTNPITYSTGRESFRLVQNAELNPIRHLLALVGARHIVHVSRIRVKNTWHYTSIFPHAFTACEGTSFFTCIYFINKKKKQQISLNDTVQKKQPLK